MNALKLYTRARRWPRTNRPSTMNQCVHSPKNIHTFAGSVAIRLILSCFISIIFHIASSRVRLCVTVSLCPKRACKCTSVCECVCSSISFPFNSCSDGNFSESTRIYWESVRTRFLLMQSYSCETIYYGVCVRARLPCVFHEWRQPEPTA